MKELLPVPTVRLKTVGKRTAQRRVDTDEIAVVIPRGTQYACVDIIGVGCLRGEVGSQDIGVVGRRRGRLRGCQEILAVRGRRILDHLKGRTHRVRTQPLGFYPECLAVVFLLVIGGQRVGLGEEVQVDAVAHRLIPLSVQVQPVVLEQELRLHGLGVLRVAHGLVEVDDAVEHLRRANPVVQCAATLLAVGRIVSAILKRCDGATEDIDAPLVGLADNLLEDLDDALGRLHTIA